MALKNMFQAMKKIPDFDGYFVTETGDVYSDKYGDLRKLKPIPDSKGYLTVHLYKNKKMYTRFVHQLVALTFINNPLGYICVNHKDESYDNNHVDNLEWCSHKYNSNYGTSKNRMRISKTQHHILQFSLSGEFIKEWFNAYDIERALDIVNTSIYRACTHKQKTAGGYVWRYKEKEVC